MPGVRTRWTRRGAVCAAGALLVSSAVVTGAGATEPARGGAPVGDEETVLEWKPCAGEEQRGFECARANVPLDHARPGRRTIELAVIRRRATDSAARVGSLFFNPGGPGGPGTVGLPALYAKFPEQLRERYDIISWDPRGIGESTAVRCFDTAEEALSWHARVPAFPVGAQQAGSYIAAYADLARRCERRDPELLRHVSTADTARDLDRLRRAVGERQLSYWGISYGSFLGATYANLFPQRVGRLVLDGNVDPQGWMTDGSRSGPELPTFLRLGSDLGSADTLEKFLELCGRAPASGCAFSAGSPSATRAKLSGLLQRIVKRPVGPWTYARTVSEIRGGIYRVTPEWATLAKTLQTLWEGRTPLEPAPPPGPLRYPGFEQLYGVMCGESPNPRDPGGYAALDSLSTARAGDLGHWWTWAGEPCATWPARASMSYTGPWDRPTAHPILVVNPTYDPATPYQGGKAMARELADARLLTLNGYGHTALDNPSRCVGRYAVRYFVEGVLPPEGATCGQDTPPFATQTPTAGAAAGAHRAPASRWGWERPQAARPCPLTLACPRHSLF
ncbi:alpha/beta hydrolase [Streptomyces sp. NPDC006208]|uniref:alpha/beta hydrolase n=1 Tax=Streptomyces sp. NPDC006208 TaxID=3156734 RepID=UPI0033B406E7